MSKPSAAVDPNDDAESTRSIVAEIVSCDTDLDNLKLLLRVAELRRCSAVLRGMRSLLPKGGADGLTGSYTRAINVLDAATMGSTSPDATERSHAVYHVNSIARAILRKRVSIGAVPYFGDKVLVTILAVANPTNLPG